MILLITGASHAGKTALAQKLLERHHYPALSQDHLKMGLIRSGNTDLTPMSPDGELTAYLWPITREMIKTAIENRQNLIVEGCYIPLDWAKDFPPEYREHIRFCCLVLSEGYIRSHFADIRKYANVAEERLDDSGCIMASVLEDNAHYLSMAQQHGVDCLVIREDYEKEIGAFRFE
jgi:2-phosphoglycerate kinase